MKRVSKLVCVTLAAVFCMLPAACSPARQFSTPGFTITDYSVTAVVSEANVYEITEVIRATFEEGRHGIFRTIPVNTPVVREAADGSLSTRKVGSKITNLSVEGWNYRVKTTEREVTIYFGDDDRLVEGEQTYRFSYKLHVTTDGTLGFDEVYYNIVGTNWPVTIERLSFSVTLPKRFDADRLGFSVGYRGDSGYDPKVLSVFVEGNTVRGAMRRELYPSEAVTMRAVLPSGYFQPNDVRRTDWIVMRCMGGLTLAAFAILLLFGRAKRPTITTEFYPPDGLTPAEIGYFFDGAANARDQAAMLLYWADKGYLSIRETADGDFELTKRGEPGDQAKPFERHMFRALFRAGDTVLARESKLYVTMFDVQRMIAASAGKELSPQTRESRRIQGQLTFLAWLPLAVTLSMSLAALGEGWWFGILMGTMCSVVMMAPLFVFIHLLRDWDSRKRRWLKLVLALGLFAGVNVFYALVAAPTFLEPLRPAAAALSALLIGICAGRVRVRTDQGNDLMGRILGFRDFIVRSERDAVERAVEKDLSYCYGILPYAFVFGVFDRWAERFTSALYAPAWLETDQEFSPQRLTRQLSSAMACFQSGMVSHAASGGSGSHTGSSGGGSSGGGSGGGGGGSW